MNLLLFLVICLFLFVNAQKPITVVQTSYAGDRMTQKPDITWQSDFQWENTIIFDPSKKYQAVLGFGAAFTEAASINVSTISLPSYFEI